MEPAERIVIACLLLEEGADLAAVTGLLDALAEGIRRGEADSLAMKEAFMDRAGKGPLPQGPAGLVIRFMLAKLEHDAVCRRFGMVARGMDRAVAAMASAPSGGLAAKIMVSRLLEAFAPASGSVAAGARNLAAGSGRESV